MGTKTPPDRSFRAHGHRDAVVLFHAWPPGTLDALPAIVDGLRDLGVAFVRIDALERFAGPAAAAPPATEHLADATERPAR